MGLHRLSRYIHADAFVLKSVATPLPLQTVCTGTQAPCQRRRPVAHANGAFCRRRHRMGAANASPWCVDSEEFL